MHCETWIHLTVVTGVLAGWVSAASAYLPPDRELDDRRATALSEAADEFVPMESYEGEESDCWKLSRDAHGLVARLELHAMGEEKGISPSEAEPLVEHIAVHFTPLVGTREDPGRCHFKNYGSSVATSAAPALAYMLHEYGNDWSSGVESAISDALHKGYYDESVFNHLKSTYLRLVAADLLGGEALEDDGLFDRGLRRLEKTRDYTMTYGPIELNSPTYSTFVYLPLVMMQAVDDPEASALAQTLLEYLFVVHSHTYLPDAGGLGAPQDRDYEGGVADDPTAMHQIYWLLMGSPDDREYGTSMAVERYRMPPILRSIYLDKGDGYHFHNYASPAGYNASGRVPNGSYELGDGGAVNPWHTVMLPGGNASIGISYGYRPRAIQVTSGVYVYNPHTGDYEILYHYQPFVDYRGNTPPSDPHCRCPSNGLACVDTFDTGTTFSENAVPKPNDDPDDFISELYDFERQIYERTLVQIWDPTLRDKDESRVARICRDTRVHLPNFDEVGGEMTTRGRWRVGKLGEVFVGFRPLGELGTDEARGGGDWQFLRLDGVSGSIVELATTDEFDDLESFADDLADRDLQFETEARAVEFEARSYENDELVPIRLAYRGEDGDEDRFVDGNELSHAEALDHGLVSSPFASWNSEKKQLRLERRCFEGRLYDWDDATIETLPPPEHCRHFSDVEFFGNVDNWEPETPERWSVAYEGGDKRYFMTEPDLRSDSGDRLGEYSLVSGRTYTNFTMRLRAKTVERLEHNSSADYAVVLGFQDENNYLYLLANSDQQYSALFAVEEGARDLIAETDGPLVEDDAWHDLELERKSDQITVHLDGRQRLRTTTDLFSSGRLGVGAFNDSVAFDDIDVHEPSSSGGDAGAEGVGTGDAHNGGPDHDGATESEVGVEVGSGSSEAAAERPGCSCNSSPGTGVPGSLLAALFAFLGLAVRRLR